MNSSQGWKRLGIAFLVVLAGSSVALAGPGASATRTGVTKHLPLCFEDGRVMDENGQVGPTQDGRMVVGDPLDPGPAAACFAEGTQPTPEQWQFINQLLQGGFQSRYNASQRWPGVAGDPISLSWSFVPDGLITGSSGNQLASNLFSTLDTQFASRGGRAAWMLQFQRVFDRWSALSGITYTYVNFGGNDWDDGAAWGSAGQSGRRGDVRISMHNIDGVNNVLAYNNFPSNGDMVIDSSENWASGSTFLFLRNVVAHEHGHGLGFAHVCPANSTKLMEPFISTSYDGPQQDDIRAVQEFYGDSFEPNDTASTATDLGTPTPGVSQLYGLVPSPSAGSAATLGLSPGSSAGSTDDDVDYYRITVDAPRLLNVTVTPVGSTYTDVDQNQDGSCQTSGVITNSLTQANMVVSVTTSFGTGILRTSDVNAAGSNEQISSLLLNQGVNLIRVSSSQAMSQTQLYRLLFTVGAETFAPDASDGTFTDGVHISWPAIPDATGYAVNRFTSDTFGLSATIATDLSPASTSFVDTTATPGQVYYYWIRAQQTGSTAYRYITQAGEQGSRGVPNLSPVANAGPDITVTDTDNGGSETVVLNGSASSDADGTILTYAWTEGANVLASSGSPTASVSFSVGVHTVQLRVTDNLGASATDLVTVTVLAGGPSCDPDVNQDGVTDQGDVDYLINVVAGGPNPAGVDADFNRDGVTDQGDIDALVDVVAGGPCP